MMTVSVIFSITDNAMTSDKPSREMLLEGLLRATGNSESTVQRPPATQETEGSKANGERGRSSSVCEWSGEGNPSVPTRRRLSHPVAVSLDETPLAGGGSGDEDLEDRVEDAGDYADDICIRGDGGGGGGEGGDLSGEGADGAVGAFYEVRCVLVSQCTMKCILSRQE